MDNWRSQMKFDPLTPLLASGDQALTYFTRRDLLGEPGGPVEQLWKLPGVQKMLKKQRADGAWSRPGQEKFPAINTCIIETWRRLRILVEQYGFTPQHPQATRAAEYLFTCQTPQGDIRGILANQYATYYTGAILSTLIQVGYAEDPRVEKGLSWLLSMRQDDLGWSIPLITHKFDRLTQYRLTSQYAEPVEPDRSKPFSHNWTGMVLRAFAAYPRHRHSEATRIAANLLKSRFFQPDCYTSYQAASYWVRFEYPYWWNNLLAALDTLAQIGLSRHDPDIQRGLSWLVEHQQADGLWKITYAREQEKETARGREMKFWISLAICRVFKRFWGRD